GERWALLVVRELVLGPTRFTDLRAGLLAASPNVLSQRLRELEEHGVVARRVLPRPASATVYELTAWGRELEPVILALGRWGSRAAQVPGGELSVDATMLALRTTFDAEAAEGLRARIAVQLGSDEFRLHVARRRIEISRGSGDDCDATLTTDPATLRAVVFGGRPVASAKKAGALAISGDEALVVKVLGLFVRPAPAAP
ncbi:MAG TPA: winged helix-turn-helix transcriptional regulator, partial [Nannocystis sp.]